MKSSRRLFASISGSSMALAVALSMVGSLCYVISLMAVAFPAFIVRTKRNGTEYSVWAQGCFLLLYSLGQLGAAGFSTIGSWFGPVAITLPVYMGSMMLWNLIVMSALRMQSFSRSQQIGILVLVIATIMLIDAGPSAEASDGKSGIDLVSSTPSIVWALAVGVTWGLSCAGMVADLCAEEDLTQTQLMLIYVTAQATATSAVTTLGKLLVMTEGAAFMVVGMLLATTAFTNVYSNIMAARKINQAQFIPLASCLTLIINQLTGLIMWEDWATIHSWVTYTGIHILIVLEMYDICKPDLLATARESRRTSLNAIGKSLSMPTLPSFKNLVALRSPRNSLASNPYAQLQNE